MPELSEEQRKQLEEKMRGMSPEQLRELQKQQCIFCQIIAGKVPAKKIHEGPEWMIILDINPAARGHLLIIPREHYSIMPQIPDDKLATLFIVTKTVSQSVLRVLKASGTMVYVANGATAGQRSQHFMIHLIPRKEGDQLFHLEEKMMEKGVLLQIEQTVGVRLQALLGLKPKKAAELPPPPPVPPPPAEIKKEEGEKEDDFSLDDIANLFK